MFYIITSYLKPSNLSCGTLTLVLLLYLLLTLPVANVAQDSPVELVVVETALLCAERAVLTGGATYWPVARSSAVCTSINLVSKACLESNSSNYKQLLAGQLFKTTYNLPSCVLYKNQMEHNFVSSQIFYRVYQIYL